MSEDNSILFLSILPQIEGEEVAPLKTFRIYFIPFILRPQKDRHININQYE